MNEVALQRRAQIGKERRANTRRKLLTAAAQVIADVGGGRATVDDVIQAADVARGTFYNYFPDWNALLGAIWEEMGRDPFLSIQNACAQFDDPAVRLFIKMRLILLRTAEDPTWGWLVFAMSGDKWTLNEDLAKFPRSDLIEGLKSSKLAFDNLDSANHIVVASIRAAMLRTLQNGYDAFFLMSVCVTLMKALGLTKTRLRSLSEMPLPNENDVNN
jgi:AcrR family transcriptional regulator